MSVDHPTADTAESVLVFPRSHIEWLPEGKGDPVGYNDDCKDCRHGRCSTCKGAGKVQWTFGNCTACHGQGGKPCAQHR